MRTKKRRYFVWMIVFILLVFVGCSKKPDSDTKDEQKELVEKALKNIEQKMHSADAKVKSKKIKRSLAQHVLKDHVALMAHFQSQQFTKMGELMVGNATVSSHDGDGNPIKIDPTAGFWKTLYDNKADLDGVASVELVIYATDISLTDIVPIDEDKKDCQSTEFFKFKILAIDENGNVISNQDDEGEWDRRHSSGCPWG